MVSSWVSARARVALLAPISTKGILAPAGTFISERTERTSLTSLTIQPISSSAGASASPSNTGQLERHSRLARSTPTSTRRAHNSSVMKGMNGCRSFNTWSSTQAAVARVSALASASSPLRIGLASSRYQSQKVPQVNS